MQIEGTYTFPAAIDRVFAALLNPDALERLIPNCERLIQLGPMTPTGSVTFEIRLRRQNGPLTLTLKTTELRQPDHLRLELRGAGAEGPVVGQGLIDLVEQETHTVGAYVLMLETAEVPAAPTQAAIAKFCERLANYLYTLGELERERDDEAEYSRAYAGYAGTEAAADVESVATMRSGAMLLPPTRVRPLPVMRGAANGKIVTWPRRQWQSLQSVDTGQWGPRLLWMTTGMVLGVSLIALAIGLVRWFGDHGE